MPRKSNKPAPRKNRRRSPWRGRLLLAVVLCAAAWGVSAVVRHNDAANDTAALTEPRVPDAGETSADARSRSADKADEDAAAGGPRAPGLSLVIDKSSHTLSVMRDGAKVREYGVAVGKNRGDKQRVGDMRTPEGSFTVQQIQNASSWTHDFGDGKGQIAGAYGPRFIRLKTPPWRGIGIHGTHAPDSIGTDVTEGCIRLGNADLLELVKTVKIGTVVRIEP